MFRKILIANRGEIAVRILRAVQDAGASPVAVFAADEADALHARLAGEAHPLPGEGAAAYLDIAAIVETARRNGCDAVHPGYGFLSEREDFARACIAAGLAFIGPRPETLALFGDKARALALAAQCGVPVLPGTGRAVTAQEAVEFFERHRDAGIMLKAIGGGGGRGMRAVTDASGLAAAYARCASEAKSFGTPGVYAERLMPHARHVEVQVIGDGKDVVVLGDRDCTIQQRFQKMVEIAPAPSLSAPMREALARAALSMARASGYASLGTFEFLVNEEAALPFAFIEANPRLQVEHTVTEAVTGLDLVELQLRVAAGATLAQLGLREDQVPAAHGIAVQWRITASEGRIVSLAWPGGPGIRVDTCADVGLQPGGRYDPLIAKLVVHSPSEVFADVVRRSRRALAEVRIEGASTNLELLRAIAAQPEFEAQQLDTAWLAREAIGAADVAPALPAGGMEVRAPMACRLVELPVLPGDAVAAGASIAVVEAMKMEHVLHAPRAGRVREVVRAVGESVAAGALLVTLDPVENDASEAVPAAPHEPGEVRPDLQRVIDRHAFLRDENRPAAVARRHAAGGRTARENVGDLCDEGSFIEYGALAVAAQSRRRSMDDLIANTPADGLVSGIGTVNAAQFGPEKSRCIVMAYDYTVLAGTQGMRNHQKKDRMLTLAHRLRLPVVLFAEGGGGRPGDVDMPVVAGLNNHTFSQFAALSGKVPVVGIVHGRCFAGNAALLGCADVIIATRGSNIGMSGPAMIEGGGLGRFRPEDIGPSGVQSRNGVIDVLVEDEAEAVATARRYLSYFQGPVEAATAPDPLALRHVVPENRLRVYEMRDAARGLVDEGSLLELRRGFGAGMITALARIGGRPVGLMANDPKHLGGAIDPEAADKASRFMQLCNAHGLPIVSLTDTPGFMVGPDIEAQAQVRHACRMFVAAARLEVPFFAVVLRKGYGLGAQAMTAGGFDAPVFTVAWPTGEFGAMGLEGAVRLGFRKELEAEAPGAARDALFQRLLAQQYENGQAMNMAATLEIDAVIDPAETRAWLVRGLASAPAVEKPGAHRGPVDPW